MCIWWFKKVNLNCWPGWISQKQLLKKIFAAYFRRIFCCNSVELGGADADQPEALLTKISTETPKPCEICNLCNAVSISVIPEP